MTTATKFRYCGGCGARIYDHQSSCSYCTDFRVEWRNCPGCERRDRGDLAPSHNGLRSCESGSIASGGNKAHCTCDSCF